MKTLGNGMVHEHTYDGAGRETLLRNLGPAGNALAVYTATYDAVGNRLTVEEFDGVRVTYAYDAAYRLTAEERSGANAYCTSYVYDPVGNRLQKLDPGMVTTYTYNVADELLTVTMPTGEVTTSTWDANGNIQSEDARGVVTTYVWDDENRLTQMAYAGGSVDTMTYAADGLRRKRETSSATGNFLWDNVNLLQELDAGLSTVAHYTDFPGEWGGLVSMQRGGGSSFYGFDQQVNTRLLASLAGGTTDTYVYKAFGEELVASGATVNPFRFGGGFGYYRAMAEPVYVRARHLNVALGRWLSRDPLGLLTSIPGETGWGEEPGDAPGMDRPLPEWSPQYAYVASGPVGRIDPSGAQLIIPAGCCYAIGQLETRNALQAAAASGLPGEIGGPQDAYRHCLWMCKITRRLGGWCAMIVGAGHEWQNSRQEPPQPPEHLAMDTSNNQVGIEVGRSGAVSCDQGCRDALHAGRLRLLPPWTNVPPYRRPTGGGPGGPRPV